MELEQKDALAPIDSLEQADDKAQLAIEKLEASETLESRINLPFSYARDKGVLFTLENDKLYLCFKEMPKLETLNELKRLIKTSFFNYLFRNNTSFSIYII